MLDHVRRLGREKKKSIESHKIKLVLKKVKSFKKQSKTVID